MTIGDIIRAVDGSCSRCQRDPRKYARCRKNTNRVVRLNRFLPREHRQSPGTCSDNFFPLILRLLRHVPVGGERQCREGWSYKSQEEVERDIESRRINSWANRAWVRMLT